VCQRRPPEPGIYTKAVILVIHVIYTKAVILVIHVDVRAMLIKDPLPSPPGGISQPGRSSGSSAPSSPSSRNSKDEKKPNIPGFLTKTYEIFASPEFTDLCGWGENGNTIIIKKVSPGGSAVCSVSAHHPTSRHPPHQANNQLLVAWDLRRHTHVPIALI
jgi:hypothetical protein